MKSKNQTLRKPRVNRYSPDIVQGYLSSGLSKSEYARRNGIHPNVMYRWIARYEEENQNTNFVKIEPKNILLGQENICEIILPDGITVKISGHEISTVQIGNLVKELRMV